MGLNDAGVSYIELRAKMDQLKRDINSAGAMVDKQVGTQTKKLGSKLGAWTKSHWAGIARSGGLALAAGAGLAVKEFIDAEKVAAQTEARLKSTGAVANVTADEIAALAEVLMTKSGVDDEAIASSENMLLTFTAVRNEVGQGNDIFNQATQSALDLSVAMGTDVTGAALQVGKALQDPVRGMTALRRSGVAFSSEQEDMVKALVESGDVMGAQKLILAELKTEFGGAAEAAGKTLGGSLNRLKESALNAGGALAEEFAPEIQSTVDALQGYTNLVTEAGKATDRAAESNTESIRLMMELREGYEAGHVSAERYATTINNLTHDESLSETQRASLILVTRALTEAERRGIDVTDGHTAAYRRNHLAIMGVDQSIKDLIRDINNVPDMPVSSTTPSAARQQTRETGSGKPGLAMGGVVQPFRAYKVGERGPEIFTSDVAGRIIPNDQIGGGLSIYVDARDSATEAAAYRGVDAALRKWGRIDRARSSRVA